MRIAWIFDNLSAESGISCRLELDLQSFSAPEVRSWSFASTLRLAKAAAQAQRNFDIQGV